MTRRNKKEALCFPHLKETVGFQEERVLRTGLTRKVLKLFAHLFGICSFFYCKSKTVSGFAKPQLTVGA